MKTILVLAALLVGGALLALAPGAAADDRYETCHGDPATAELCYNKRIVVPGYVVGVHTAAGDADPYVA